MPRLRTPAGICSAPSSQTEQWYRHFRFDFHELSARDPIDDVHPPPDPIRITSLRRVIIENNLVWNLFDQSPSEHRGRNSEDHVITSQFPSKIRLLQNAPICVLKSCNRENRMDAAIRGLAIRIKLEPRLAYGAILGHEAWKSVCLFEILFEEIELR